VNTVQLITSSYSEIAGFATLRSLGTSLLWTALGAWMVVELYRLYMNGRADFFTPIIKIAAAVAIINALPGLGDVLASSMNAMADMMFEKNVQQLAAKAWTTAFKSADPGLIDTIKAIFSPVAWICLLTYLQLVGIMIIKFAVIDVIWPVMMGLVVFSGLLAVPIGVFPGVNSFKGWVLNVVEVSIWPLVFQLVTTLLLGCFSGQLERLAALDVVWDKVDEMQERAEEAEMYGDVEGAARLREEISNQGADGPLFTLIKFLAINTAFAFLCIFTPFISRKIVRGESAGFLGGVMTAVATRIIYRAGAAAGRYVGGMVSSIGERYAYNSPLLAKSAATGAGTQDPAERLDRRSPAVAAESGRAGRK